MGKTKQVKEKKFDRNVEISAPILDPEIIKAIHSPPKGQKIDIRHGGFKALLSDLNSQDSMDEFTSINDNHVPSYIGISCAVSGYSGYSSYNNNNNINKKPLENITNTRTTTTTRLTSTPNRSQTSSPISSANRDHHVRHITIDKSSVKSPDDERIKLTEELTASATERRRSPSPLPPLEDERHHGAYVGARYFPMPPPSKLVNKHIPLLGIDDDQDPDQMPPDDANKVEKKIATLYGDNFVEDWKESMSHKAKKEHLDDDHNNEQGHQQQQSGTKLSPKDLVTLKPTPKVAPKSELSAESSRVEVPTPNIKVLHGVEKQFLNKLLTDENPPMPKSPPTSPKTKSTPTEMTTTAQILVKEDPIHSSPMKASSPPVPAAAQPMEPVEIPRESSGQTETKLERAKSPELAVETEVPGDEKRSTSRDSPAPPTPTRDHLHDDDVDVDGDQEDDYDDQHSQSPQPPMSPDSGKNQSINEEVVSTPTTTGSQVAQNVEEHIEYEIRAQSPVDNQASPVRLASGLAPVGLDAVQEEESSLEGEKQPQLVSFSPEPTLINDHSQLIGEQHSSQVDAKLTELGNESLLLDLMGDDQPQSLQPSQANELITSAVIHQSTPMEQTPTIANDDESPELKVAEELVATTIMTATSSAAAVAAAPEEAGDKTTGGDAAGGDNNNKGSYYLELLEEESSFILGQVQRAEAVLAEREHELDEDAIGRIRSAIGKANLLINKKCNQFKELCETSIKGDANEQYAVLNDDLAGFWDMLSIQFSDVRKSFEKI